MLPPEFVDACNNAIYSIGLGVCNAQLAFGAEDFPEDGGVSFRNDVYKYAYCYFLALFHYLDEESKDSWTIRNGETVLRLKADHLVRIAGTSHFYVSGRQMHLSNVDPRNRHMRITLDWLANAYHVPNGVPECWFKIVTTNRDHDAYYKSALGLFYTDIAGAIASNIDDDLNASAWGGVAFAAEMIRFGLEEDEWAPRCDADLALCKEEAKRRRGPS